MNKIQSHIKQYSSFISWLVSDLYTHYRWKLIGVSIFTFAGLSMQTGAVYVCYNYAKALENNTTYAWFGWELLPRSSFFMLSVVATVVMIMTIVSAVLVMWGRKIGLQLARDYTDYCSARVYVLTSTVSTIPKLNKNEDVSAAKIASLARGDSLSAGMMVRIITFSLIYIGTVIVAGGALFMINVLLSLIVVFILAITSIFFYKNSIKGAASRMALQKFSVESSVEQKILEDRLSYGVAPINYFDVGMSEIFKKGASYKFSQAFVKQRFVLEENNLIAQIVIGISIFLIILIQGHATIATIGQGEDWSALLIYLVAFSLFSSCFARTARMLASINRFYPDVNGYSKFIIAISKQMEYEKNNSIKDISQIKLFIELEQELIELKKGMVLYHVAPCPIDKYQASIFIKYIWAINNENKKKYCRNLWLVSSRHSLLKTSLRESLSLSESLSYKEIKSDVLRLDIDMKFSGFPYNLDRILSEKDIKAIEPQLLFLFMLVSGKYNNVDIIMIDEEGLSAFSKDVQGNIFHYLYEKIIIISSSVNNIEVLRKVEEGIVLFSDAEKIIGHADLMNDEKNKINTYLQKIKLSKNSLKYDESLSNTDLDEVS